MIVLSLNICFKFYIQKRFKNDFQSSLNDSIFDYGEFDPFYKVASNLDGLYDRITEKAIEKSFRVVGLSKYFNSNILKEVNFTPSISDLIEDCEASQMINFVDGGLVNFTDLKQIAKDMVYELNVVWCVCVFPLFGVFFCSSMFWVLGVLLENHHHVIFFFLSSSSDIVIPQIN